MGYDIPNFHIDDASLEGRTVREIVEREGVTPEEAVRLGLRRLRAPTPAEEAIGALSSPEDRAVLEEAMTSTRRDRWEPREIDI